MSGTSNDRSTVAGSEDGWSFIVDLYACLVTEHRARLQLLFQEKSSRRFPHDLVQIFSANSATLLVLMVPGNLTLSPKSPIVLLQSIPTSLKIRDISVAPQL